MTSNAYMQQQTTGTTISYPIQRLSYAKKKAYDFKWVEGCADFYDYYFGNYYDNERIKRLKTNYQLYNGRGEEAMKAYNQGWWDDLIDEGIEGGFGDVQHHSIIDQIAKAMAGEQQRRSLRPLAIDASGYNMNMRKMQRNKLYQRYMEQKIIYPIRNMAVQKIAMQQGITDLYSMSPEQQKEFNFMVEQEVLLNTPDEIENYMRKDYKSPSEVQVQKLLDYVMNEYDIKYLTDEGFKHAIITGEEIYYTGVRHNKPYVELVNPMGFTSSGARNTHFIEDGEWAKYERYIKYTDLFNQFGDVMEEKHYKKIEEVFNKFSGGGSDARGNYDSRLVAEIATADSYSDGKLFDNAPDMRTAEGQKFVQSMYRHFGTAVDDYNSVRHVHIVYKSLRKLYYITRENARGEEENFWVDETYRFNKAKGDKRMKTVWAPELWEVDKIGTADAIYLNKRRIPFQNRSADDPWDVKLPYIGVEYGKLFGNTKNVSPVDLGKPWQYKFNVQMAKIHEMEATDVGKVLLTTMGGKPAEWSWGKWIMMMKYGHIAPINTEDENFQAGIDTNIFKAVDLSTLTDLAGRLQYLEFIRNQVALAMSYNPSRLGQVAPYVAVTNNQQNIVQSSYQTEDLYSTHNKVVEHLLNALMRCARVAYKNNELVKTYLLDDMSIAELDLDWQMLDPAVIGVKVRNSSDDYNNVMEVKSVAQAMVQNGLMTMPELIKVIWARDGAEMLNIAENAQLNAEKMRKQEQEMMREQAEMQRQMALEMEQLRQNLELEKQSREHDKDILVAKISATRDAQAYDLNKNQINDNYELEQMRLRHAAVENEKDRQLELAKHKDEMNLRRIEARKKPAPKK